MCVFVCELEKKRERKVKLVASLQEPTKRGFCVSRVHPCCLTATHMYMKDRGSDEQACFLFAAGACVGMCGRPAVSASFFSPFGYSMWQQSTATKHVHCRQETHATANEGKRKRKTHKELNTARARERTPERRNSRDRGRERGGAGYCASLWMCLYDVVLNVFSRCGYCCFPPPLYAC